MSLIDIIAKIKNTFISYRTKRRWEILKKNGLKVGNIVLINEVFIDTSHCFLISIGNRVGFGPNVSILAHDAFMKRGTGGYTKVGLVTIEDDCKIGANTVILPGVTIGKDSIIGANSVVSEDIPPDSLAIGNPIKIVASASKYIESHKKRIKSSPIFPYDEYDIGKISEDKKMEMIEKLKNGPGYIFGGP